MRPFQRQATRPSTGATLLIVGSIALTLALSTEFLHPHAADDGAGIGRSLSSMPDFNTFESVDDKKMAFFNWLTPYIEQENARIESTRQRILALHHAGQLDEEELQWLTDTSSYYDVVPLEPESAGFWATLLRRVDVIPVSLALAQAANESGWGTSRFAVAANNLFGEWCFRKGCGIVPSNRSPGQFHEVRKFPDIADSVRSYLHNLNTHRAFATLRRQREILRKAAQKIAGSALTPGLMRYSARGTDYIQDIEEMIRHNRLERFDKRSYL